MATSIKVTALLVGAPGPTELWTLRRLAEAGFSLNVIEAISHRKSSKLKHLQYLISRQGLLSTTSRVLGSVIFGRHEETCQKRQLAVLFDFAFLDRWWSTSGVSVTKVPYLNHGSTAEILGQMQPDFIVRVSGGVLGRQIFSSARVATLNIHHGVASRIRGMWSIPWALLEGQPDWVGATVHVVDAGIDTGTVLWSGSPQLAAGDSSVDLFFRVHLQAVEALVSSIVKMANGWQPLQETPLTDAVYRSAPGLFAWVQYLALCRGKRSRTILQTTFRC